MAVPDLTDTLEQTLTDGEPLKAAVDGRSAESHPLPDQIEAIKFLQGVDSVAGTNPNGGPVSGWAGLRPARVIPPGAA